MRFIVAILIAVAFAGCAEDAPPSSVTQDPGTAAPAPKTDTPAPADPETAPPAVTPATFRIHRPEGVELAGVTFDLPNTFYQVFEGSSFYDLRFYVEPYYTVAPDEMMVLVFEDGALHTALPFTNYERTSYLTAALPSTSSGSLEGAFVSMTYFEGFEERPDDISIVVAAKGGQDVGIGLQFMRDRDQEPIEDASWSGRLAWPIHGTGTGFDLQLYEEIATSFLARGIGIIGTQTRIGDGHVTEHQPTYVFPHGGAREATLRVETQAMDGWHFAATSSIFMGDGVQQWDHQGGTPGGSFADDGFHADVQREAFLVNALVFGFPIGASISEGQGNAQASIDFMGATNNDLYAAGVVAISVGATLDELVGVPAVTGHSSFPGLVVSPDAGFKSE